MCAPLPSPSSQTYPLLVDAALGRTVLAIQQLKLRQTNQAALVVDRVFGTLLGDLLRIKEGSAIRSRRL
jgi:hypothetical protein